MPTVVNIYVDTDVAGPGTGSIGDPYDGLQLAIDTESGGAPNQLTGADLVTNDEQAVFICVGAAADTVIFANALFTVDATRNIIYRGEVSADGKYDTSKYRVEHTTVSNGNRAFYDNHNFTEVEDMQVEITNSTHTGTKCYELAGTDHIYRRCLGKCIVSGTAEVIVFSGIAGGTDGYSCLALDNKGGSTTQGATNAGFYGGGNWFNCGAHNCVTGFFPESFGAPSAVNCWAQDCDDGFDSTNSFTTARNNCSDIASDAPGTDPQTGTILFVDKDGDDFQPASGDTLAKDNGSDESVTFDFDLTNASFGTDWDIGPRINQIAAASFLPASHSTQLVRY